MAAWDDATPGDVVDVSVRGTDGTDHGPLRGMVKATQKQDVRVIALATPLEVVAGGVTATLHGIMPWTDSMHAAMITDYTTVVAAPKEG